MKLIFTEEEYEKHKLVHRVLVVDDEKWKAHLVIGVAEANGFGCKYARSAPEALEILLKSPYYEFLITDNDMYHSNSGVDPKSAYLIKGKDWGEGKDEGLELIRRVKKSIKKHPDLKDMGIILHSHGNVELQAKYLGVEDVGHKLYLLNDILRERSELYKVNEKKSFFNFFKS